MRAALTCCIGAKFPIGMQSRRSFLQQFFKRSFDVLVATSALVVLSPFLLMVALAVRLSMGSPIFFRQPRPGRNDAVFEIVKFRTMSELIAEKSCVDDSTDTVRVSRLGAILRRTSIDELPELVNIVRGDMSIVGPRPLLVAYLDRYTDDQRRRHDVRPGLTGLAQVSGRNATTWDARLNLDVWYVDHQSFGLDLRIIARTIGMVLTGRGVNAGPGITMTQFDGSKTQTERHR